jgi:CheY-like chemotaxis protein
LLSESQTGLTGRRVMVVEDELLVAMGLEDALTSLGCEVLGPFPSLAEANAALDAGAAPDAAVLDVNVRGEFVYPLAERLKALKVPVVLCSGYAEVAMIPTSFAGMRRVSKPFSDEVLVEALADAIRDAESSPGFEGIGSPPARSSEG